MKKNLNGIGIIFFILMILLVQLNIQTPELEGVEEMIEKPLPVLPFEIKKPKVLVSNEGIIDPELSQIFITVFDSKPVESVTIGDINDADYTESDVYIDDQEDPYVYAYFDTTDTSGVVFPNSTLEIRGQSARIMEQKSYKIKLFDDTGLWFGHRIVNLNKHFEDPTKIKNKLSFDLFYGISNFSSMETKFVQVFIKDLSSHDTEFTSYGLFTFIEQPNEDFIEQVFHDEHGGLYKAEFFEFYNYDEIVSSDDPRYDEDAFEHLLEIRGSDDHNQLKQMLIDLNDYNLDIMEIVDLYFDEDNMLTWLATNILLNNYDTSSRNFMLYNPTHTKKWYFLPWDYDKAWSTKSRDVLWQRGLSNYWGMVLYNRYFKKEGNFEKFQSIFESVYETLTPELIEPLSSSYVKQVKELVYSEPDVNFIGITSETYDELVSGLKYVPLSQYIYYYDHIDAPMPFYLGDPIVTDTDITFVWDASYDLQNDPLHYKLTVSNDFEFIEKIVEIDDIFTTSQTIPLLDEGEYYWRVDAYDNKNNHMMSFDFAVDDRNQYVFGAEIIEIGGDEFEE